MLITDIAFKIANFIMFQKIANVLSIISFVMVSTMSVGAFFAVRYMKSPEFERDLKNKLMGDLQEKMMKEIPLQMPTETFPAMPL